MTSLEKEQRFNIAVQVLSAMPLGIKRGITFDRFFLSDEWLSHYLPYSTESGSSFSDE